MTNEVEEVQDYRIYINMYSTIRDIVTKYNSVLSASYNNQGRGPMILICQIKKCIAVGMLTKGLLENVNYVQFVSRISFLIIVIAFCDVRFKALIINMQSLPNLF